MLIAIDVVKTRIQIDPAMKGKNMITAGRSIILNEGAAGLLTGTFSPISQATLSEITQLNASLSMSRFRTDRSGLPRPGRCQIRWI